MTPEQKIAKVLKKIKDEAAINPDPRLMRFNLNNQIVGYGFLTDDEERRILLKLESEGIIDLRLSQYKDIEPKEISVISSDEGKKFLQSTYYWVEILESFEKKYQTYLPYLQPANTKIEKGPSKNINKNNRTAGKNPLIVSGDYVAGDKIGHNKNINSDKSSLISKYWWGFFIPIIVIIIGFVITEGKSPQLLNPLPGNKIENNESGIATSTLNISDIFSKKNNFDTTLEQQNFLEKYKDSLVYGEGSFNDINKIGEIYYVYAHIGKDAIACSFTNVDKMTEQKLLLLKDNLIFSGYFTGDRMFGSLVWLVRDCTLIN